MLAVNDGHISRVVMRRPGLGALVGGRCPSATADSPSRGLSGKTGLAAVYRPPSRSRRAWV